MRRSKRKRRQRQAQLHRVAAAAHFVVRGVATAESPEALFPRTRLFWFPLVACSRHGFPPLHCQPLFSPLRLLQVVALIPQQSRGFYDHVPRVGKTGTAPPLQRQQKLIGRAAPSVARRATFAAGRLGALLLSATAHVTVAFSSCTFPFCFDIGSSGDFVMYFPFYFATFCHLSARARADRWRFCPLLPPRPPPATPRQSSIVYLVSGFFSSRVVSVRRRPVSRLANGGSLHTRQGRASPSPVGAVRLCYFHAPPVHKLILFFSFILLLSLVLTSTLRGLKEKA